MNKISEYTLKVLLVLVMVGACMYAGRMDYNDTVESEMGYEKYQFVYDCLGGGSRSEVVSEYISNKKYYDNLLNE